MANAQPRVQHRRSESRPTREVSGRASPPGPPGAQRLNTEAWEGKVIPSACAGPAAAAGPAIVITVLSPAATASLLAGKTGCPGARRVRGSRRAPQLVLAGPGGPAPWGRGPPGATRPALFP